MLNNITYINEGINRSVNLTLFSVSRENSLKHGTSVGQLHISLKVWKRSKEVLVADPRLVVSLLDPVSSLFDVPVQTK